MIASFSVSGLVPMSAAIAGSEVAITVESMFSMNRAVATISGMRRCLSIGMGWEAEERALYHPVAVQTIAESSDPETAGLGAIIPLSYSLLRRRLAYLNPA